MRPDLPIVAEISNWPMVILGAILIVVAGVVVRAAWRRDDERRLAGLALALFPLAMGLIVAGRDIGWQLRIDQNGIVLRALFEPFWPTGEIAWPDLTAVEIFSRSSRGGAHYILRFRGQRGMELWIASAQEMPPQFIAQLQAVVAERAPQVTAIKQLDRQFRNARQNSTSLTANSYSVRDGRGVLLH